MSSRFITRAGEGLRAAICLAGEGLRTLICLVGDGLRSLICLGGDGDGSGDGGRGNSAGGDSSLSPWAGKSRIPKYLCG